VNGLHHEKHLPWPILAVLFQDDSEAYSIQKLSRVFEIDNGDPFNYPGEEAKPGRNHKRYANS
jgi:hypothetical protein